MPSLDSPANRDSYWLGIVKTALIQILVFLVLSGALIFYVNWSSEAALTDFKAASTLSVPAPERHAQSSNPAHTAKSIKPAI